MPMHRAGLCVARRPHTDGPRAARIRYIVVVSLKTTTQPRSARYRVSDVVEANSCRAGQGVTSAGANDRYLLGLFLDCGCPCGISAAPST